MIFKPKHSMEVIEQSGKLTQKDRRTQLVWNTGPWVALVLITVLPPAVLGILALILGGTPMWLLAVASIPVCLIAAIIITIVLMVLRRNWVKRVRERLASDGITADEIDWFRSELTSGEKRALKSMEEQQPLLADAYRETLALRLNASRLAGNARRELLLVERRISRARYLNAPDTAVLIEELNRDRARL
jgi:hypothetical protein